MVITGLMSWMRKQIQRGKVTLDKVALLVGKKAEMRTQILHLPSSLFHFTALLLVVVMTDLPLTSTLFPKTLLPLTSFSALTPSPFL